MAADRDLVVFYRTLAEMLRAGVVASIALDSCAHVLPEASDAARIVEQGRPISEAFARFPRAFPADQVRLLQVAEQTGSVDAALADLADYAAEIIAARRVLVSGLTLPAVMLHAAAFIVPLPGLLLGAGLGGYLISSFGFLAALWGAVGAIVLFTRHAPPAVLDATLSRLPVVSDAWRDLQRWRMASSLRMLARTSLGVPASLRFAASVCRGAVLPDALRQAATTAEQRGEPASASLRTSDVLPADVIAQWRNAELTGGHEVMFARLAARFAESYRRRMQAIAEWFPRIAYGIVALYLVIQILNLSAAYIGHLAAA